MIINLNDSVNDEDIDALFSDEEGDIFVEGLDNKENETPNDRVETDRFKSLSRSASRTAALLNRNDSFSSKKHVEKQEFQSLTKTTLVKLPLTDRKKSI